MTTTEQNTAVTSRHAIATTLGDAAEMLSALMNEAPELALDLDMKSVSVLVAYMQTKSAALMLPITPPVLAAETAAAAVAPELKATDLSALDSERQRTTADAMNASVLMVQTLTLVRDLGLDRPALEHLLSKVMQIDNESAKLYATALLNDTTNRKVPDQVAGRRQTEAGQRRIRTPEGIAIDRAVAHFADVLTLLGAAVCRGVPPSLAQDLVLMAHANTMFGLDELDAFESKAENDAD
jgi:hypothetical protein